MHFQVTGLYASLLALLMAVLSIRVPIRRGILNVPWGDGGDEKLATRIRVFGNFTEYVPMILLLMALLECRETATSSLHYLGMALIFSRLLHAFSLKRADKLTRARQFGRGAAAMTTWLVLVIAAILLLR